MIKKVLISFLVYCFLVSPIGSQSIEKQAEDVIRELQIATDLIIEKTKELEDTPQNKAKNQEILQKKRNDFLKLFLENSWVPNDLQALTGNFNGSLRIEYDEYCLQLVNVSYYQFEYEKIGFAPIGYVNSTPDTIVADTILLIRKRFVLNGQAKYDETQRIYLKKIDNKFKISGIIEVKPDADADGFQDNNGEDLCLNQKGPYNGCKQQIPIIPDHANDRETIQLEGENKKKKDPEDPNILFDSIMPINLAYNRVEASFLDHVDHQIDFLKLQDNILYSCTTDGDFRVSIIDEKGKFSKSGGFSLGGRIIGVDVFNTANNTFHIIAAALVKGDTTKFTFKVTITGKKLTLKKEKEEAVEGDMIPEDFYDYQANPLPRLINIFQGKIDAPYVQKVTADDFASSHISEDSIIAITNDWIILRKNTQMEVLKGYHPKNENSTTNVSSFPLHWFQTNIVQTVFNLNEISKSCLSPDGKFLVVGLKNGGIFTLMKSDKSFFDR